MVLGREEKNKTSKILEERLLEKEANRVRINVLAKFVNKNKKNKYLEVDIEDYYQIENEFDEIYNLISKNFLKIIRTKIKEEKKKPNPKLFNYLPKVEKEMINKKNKIMDFFTFDKYFNRRIYDLETDYLEFIKKHAYQNEAYEFLEATKED